MCDESTVSPHAATNKSLILSEIFPENSRFLFRFFSSCAICCFFQIRHKNVEKWLSVYALSPTSSINHAIISSHQFFPPPKPQNLPPPFLSAQISETHFFFSQISRQKTGFLRWIRPQESCFGAEEQSHGFEFHD